MRPAPIATCLLLGVVSRGADAQEPATFDVVIYGGTAAGVVAAVVIDAVRALAR